MKDLIQQLKGNNHIPLKSQQMTLEVTTQINESMKTLSKGSDHIFIWQFMRMKSKLKVFLFIILRLF